jgi:hypothetical protein
VLDELTFELKRTSLWVTPPATTVDKGDGFDGGGGEDEPELLLEPLLLEPLEPLLLEELLDELWLLEPLELLLEELLLLVVDGGAGGAGTVVD